MKHLTILLALLLAGCQTINVNCTGVPGMTTMSCHVTVRDANNKAVPTTFEDLVDADGNTVPLTP